MKVYITYCKDGYGGSEIDKVFSNADKAINYIIETKFVGNSYYKDKSIDFIRKEAYRRIEEQEVE